MSEQTVPELRPGMTVRVHQKIKEGAKEKERLQVFEGIVIATKHGRGANATFTVRKVSDGVGVERIYPLHAPIIGKLEIVRQNRVRRAKLYYLRDPKAKPPKEKKAVK